MKDKAILDKLKIIKTLINVMISFIITTICAYNIYAALILSITTIPLYLLITTKKQFYIYSIIYGIIGAITLKYCINPVLGILTIIIIWYKSLITWDNNKSLDEYKDDIVIILFPFITLSIVEIMQDNLIEALNILFVNGSNVWSPGQHICMWATIIIIWCIYCITNIVVKRKDIALLIVFNSISFLGIINMIVLDLTMKPLMPSDILILFTALNSIEGQGVSTELIIKTIIYIVIILIVSKLLFKSLHKRKLKYKKVKTTSKIMISIIILSILIGWFSKLEFTKFHYNEAYGFIWGFITDLHSKIEKPVGYKNPNINTMPESNKYDSDIKPNVIFIMSEAFTDFNSYYNIETNEDPIPYFHYLQKNYPNGIAYSSVFGNNTVSSEYEAITGISTAFTMRGADIYNKYIKSDFYNIGTYYKQFGYKTSIIHACQGDNYNRINVYNKMGYDNMTFLENMDKDTKFLRTFVSDESNFNKVLSEINNTEEPLYMLNITMQNHSQYQEFKDVKHSIKLKNNNTKSKELEVYLSLLKESDKALENFLNKIEEPTIIVFYGDHQPQILDNTYNNIFGKDIKELNVEESTELYKVPYLIWNNFNIDSKYEVPQITSLNYISLILNRYTNQSTTEWLDLLEKTQYEYPVITENFVIDKSGKVISIDNIKNTLKKDSKELSKEEKILKEYQFACYSFFDNDK